jgi:hypothetical protein
MKLSGFIFVKVGCHMDHHVTWCTDCNGKDDDIDCADLREEDETEPIYQMMDGRDLGDI